MFAFLNALKIKYVSARPTLEALESRRLPGQKAVWEGLKVGLQWVEARKNRQASGEVLMPAEEFLATFEEEEVLA